MADRVSGVGRPNSETSSTPTRKPFSVCSEISRSPIGADNGSQSSPPCTTLNNARTSATVRAIGPITPSHAKAPVLGGKCPVEATRPGVGLNPQIPEKCAGVRIEPPPSLPTPPIELPEAIAAASPPLEPPAEYSRFQGLEVLPVSRLSDS